MFPQGPAPPLAQAYGPPPMGPPFPAQQPCYQSPPPYAPAAQPASYRPYDPAPIPPQASLSPAPRPQTSYKEVATSFLMNQNVEVQIDANVWVMGVVVAVLKVANKKRADPCNNRFGHLVFVNAITEDAVRGSIAFPWV